MGINVKGNAMKSFTHHENPMIENRPNEPERPRHQIKHWYDLPSFAALGSDYRLQGLIYTICDILLSQKYIAINAYNILKEHETEISAIEKNTKVEQIENILREFALHFFDDPDALDIFFEELDHYRHNGGTE